MKFWVWQLPFDFDASVMGSTEENISRGEKVVSFATKNWKKNYNFILLIPGKSRIFSN